MQQCRLEYDRCAPQVWTLRLPRALRLDALPSELIQQLAVHLDATSLLSLSWTSRRLYTELAPRKVVADLPPALRSNQQTRHALLSLHLATVETWPCYSLAAPSAAGAPLKQSRPRLGTPTSSSSSLESMLGVTQTRSAVLRFACHSCLTLRPPDRFALGMTTGPRGRKRRPELTVLQQLPVAHDRRDWLLAAAKPYTHRVCIACGVRDGTTYPKGTRLQYAKEDGGFGVGFVCRRCVRFVQTQHDSRELLRRTCADCLKYRPPGSRFGGSYLYPEEDFIHRQAKA